ncbi:hemerythrin domain-containing protein [Leptospira borgpetersenii]|uniref:hemerythrin domain-containing protein n=1 Tax=Leptospira borgpetersenii TaxID=174 RepID=UPI000682640D|nr:hemerythrin domain-containing protein [Leptospira borgpetersenii]TQE56032.1 hemerythrin HHE cation-binding domain protein [Leptospira borgpetersenii]
MTHVFQAQKGRHFVYKIQYIEIQKLLNDIESRLLKEGKISEDMDELLHELASFSARLKLHLNLEENLIYPKIKNLQIENTSALAENFRSCSIDLKNSFKKYYCNWLLPSSILKNESRFREETEELIFNLRDKFRKEENEIYVLL